MCMTAFPSSLRQTHGVFDEVSLKHSTLRRSHIYVSDESNYTNV